MSGSPDPPRGLLGRLARALPYLGRVIRERDHLESRWRRMQFPPGHYYSPVVDPDELASRREEIFEAPIRSRDVPGIDLAESHQLELLDAIAPLSTPFPFERDAGGDRRFFWANGFYGPPDAFLYYALLRRWQPRRLVEIGSGMSSCLALDTMDLHFPGEMHCTFIDPDPARLRRNLRPGDAGRVTILEQTVQSVDMECFTALQAGDVLFVDSSHVMKAGSDVNRILFEILPALASGVHVHFHDIFYPFEYSWAHIEQGLSWNEAYALRAFLQYNAAFEITLFASFLQAFHRERLERASRLLVEDRGCSLWLRKC